MTDKIEELEEMIEKTHSKLIEHGTTLNREQRQELIDELLVLFNKKNQREEMKANEIYELVYSILDSSVEEIHYRDWGITDDKIEGIARTIAKSLFINSYSENDINKSYDKGYNDGANAAATDISNSL